MAGRKKKYYTDEDYKEANRIKSKRYYTKNRTLIKIKNKNRYHEKKS